ncbi:hypothetical protein [Aminobacter sp. MET-1]|uniref:hypothetical protein n=1 Tax=Aminobacter sp. MET-1 TaxID=2951085 RepID=UPI002269B57C|nr:hypothetical protein [Aminobacter sp. MET-1]MCX8571112.1 hypothetical protein [Aminobacter sp. MET-1]MCX8573219.1 hypothetical protein [Aminobacter sp. MET-1]
MDDLRGRLVEMRRVLKAGISDDWRTLVALLVAVASGIAIFNGYDRTSWLLAIIAVLIFLYEHWIRRRSSK